VAKSGAGGQSGFWDDDPDLLAAIEDIKQRRIELRQPRGSVEQAVHLHGWTLNKLELLELYLKGYRRIAGSGTYIDGFAGKGFVEVDGEMHEGSAMVALRSQAFKRLFLYELPDVVPTLKKNLEQRFGWKTLRPVNYRPGDMNKKLLEDLNEGNIPRDRPCFACLDQYSTQLDWETVAALAEYKSGSNPPKDCKVELWILVATNHALVRLFPRDGQPQEATLDRVFGGREYWRDLAERTRLTTSGIARHFADNLEKRLGYGAARCQAIRDKTSGAVQYYMIHASDHPAAHTLMPWAERELAKSNNETPRMF
jgi:three-Cys-motif partner protein